MRHTRNNRGLTLVEMLVAMTLLIGLIGIVAFVFKEVGRTVEVTKSHLDRNSGIQILNNRMREDLEGLCRDGFLCIVEGEPNEPDGTQAFSGYRRPPAIIFTASGRFVSNMWSTNAVHNNAAIIAYVPCAEIVRNMQTPGRMSSAIGRYAYVLTGGAFGSGFPADPNGLLSWTHPDPNHRDNNTNELDDIDAFEDSLADVIASMPDANDAGSELWPFFYRYLDPFRAGLSAFVTAPDGDATVRSLWPYMIGGHTNLKVEVHFAESVDADSHLEWTLPVDANEPTIHWPGRVAASTMDGAPFIVWTGRDKTLWPRALRLTFTAYSADGATVEQRHQLVFDLPQ